MNDAKSKEFETSKTLMEGLEKKIKIMSSNECNNKTQLLSTLMRNLKH